MHHWVKYCVNRCMKSEVIALTSFVTDGRTNRQMDAKYFYVPPPPMASPWRGQQWVPPEIMLENLWSFHSDTSRFSQIVICIGLKYHKICRFWHTIGKWKPPRWTKGLFKIVIRAGIRGFSPDSKIPDSLQEIAVQKFQYKYEILTKPQYMYIYQSALIIDHYMHDKCIQHVFIRFWLF